MSTATTGRQAEALTKLISPGGDLEHAVQQLADVLHIWRTAPPQERRFLCVDHQAAEEILVLLHRLQQPGGNQ